MLPYSRFHALEYKSITRASLAKPGEQDCWALPSVFNTRLKYLVFNHPTVESAMFLVSEAISEPC